MIDSSHSMSFQLRNSKFFVLGLMLLFSSLSVLYYYYFFNQNGYLPTPFLSDKADTFMDFFNPLYWAYDDGRYTYWGSVYPPLNFLFLKVINFFLEGGWISDPLIARDNAGNTISFILALYLFIPMAVLKMKYWDFFKFGEKVALYFIIILSAPMLFALERGNLIVISPIFLALLLSDKKSVREISIAILINIKPYFLVLAFFYIARKKWHELFKCLFIAGGIFLFTGVVLDPNFLTLFKNLIHFQQSYEIFSIRGLIAMPSNIASFSEVMKTPEGAAFFQNFLPDMVVKYIAMLLDLIRTALLAMAFILISKKSHVLEENYIFLLLVTIISNLGVSVGGYTLIFYYVFVPVFMRMGNNFIPLCIIISLGLPLDAIDFISTNLGFQNSFLSGERVEVFWTLGLGSIVRPVLNFGLLVILLKHIFEIEKTTALNLSESRELK